MIGQCDVGCTAGWRGIMCDEGNSRRVYCLFNVGIPELWKNGTLQEKMSADIQTYCQL